MSAASESLVHSVEASVTPLPLGLMRLWFRDVGDFAATRAAEAWCEAHGISVGRMERGSPRGLLRGEFDIQKWRNLNEAERSELHGTMTGDFRDGPVMIRLQARAFQLEDVLSVNGRDV